MTAHFWFRDSNGDVVEVTDRIARDGWEVREQAEEGSAAMSTLVFDDPLMDWDIDGHRSCYILEDTSEADDDVLFAGLIADQEIGRAGGDWTQPLGRVWSVSITDRNALWQRRVMVGSDSNRPAETDVERMQWLLATTEAGWASDVTTYVSTASPVNMDACDYRGQGFAQVADDCAQASGKNWYCFLSRDDADALQLVVWYGRDTLAVYDSPLFLTNDPADVFDDALEDGTSLVWPISMDTKLRRDPSRVFSGVYLPFDGGAVYRQDSATATAFAHRDFVAPSLNVKSNTKAIARAVRYLDELDAQDEVITTTVLLPAAKATMIRAGMRVRFKATHLPGYGDSFYWMRILSCSIAPASAGTQYRLTLELSGPGTDAVVPEVVQYKSVPIDNQATQTITLDEPITEGHTLVLVFSTREPSDTPTYPAGWTEVSNLAYTELGGTQTVAWKTAGAAEPQTVVITGTTGDYARLTMAELANAGTYVSTEGEAYSTQATEYVSPPLSATGPGFLLGSVTSSNSEAGRDAELTPPIGWLIIGLGSCAVDSPYVCTGIKLLMGDDTISTGYGAFINWDSSFPFYPSVPAGLTPGGGAAAIVSFG